MPSIDGGADKAATEWEVELSATSVPSFSSILWRSFSAEEAYIDPLRDSAERLVLNVYAKLGKKTSGVRSRNSRIESSKETNDLTDVAEKTNGIKFLAIGMLPFVITPLVAYVDPFKMEPLVIVPFVWMPFVSGPLIMGAAIEDSGS
jgi:hypothetical protein